MIFGFAIPTWGIIAGGATVFTLLIIQALIGLRIIKLGRKHTTYHRYLAFLILTVAFFHASAAIIYLTGVSLF